MSNLHTDVSRKEGSQQMEEMIVFDVLRRILEGKNYFRLVMIIHIVAALLDQNIGLSLKSLVMNVHILYSNLWQNV